MMRHLMIFESFEYEILTIDKLIEKFPKMKFTLEPNTKFKDRYFARADIETQGGDIEYLGALKGPVTLEKGIDFLNNVANKNYDKYY